MKYTLRKHYKSLRNNISEENVLEKSKQIISILLSADFYQQAQNIMCYLSFQKEVHTDEIFLNAWQNQKSTAIPISNSKDHTIVPALFTDFNQLELSSLSIRELPACKIQPCNPDNFDLCIIPGIAFDCLGNRLGFGQGYYDRFLPQLNPRCIKIALAFSEQIHQNPLPIDAYDIPMDYIITEAEIISCKKQ